jgi:hypothetical protein
MGVKGTCLKVRSLRAYLSFLIILSAFFVASLMPTAAIMASSTVVTPGTNDDDFNSIVILKGVSRTPLASTANGTAGSNVTISGTGFAPHTDAKVWFDTNGNMKQDLDEPFKTFATTEVGSIPAGIYLIVPPVSPGNYHILIDCPIGEVVEISVDIVITETPTLTSTWLLIGGAATLVVIVVILIVIIIRTWTSNVDIKKTKAILKNSDIEVRIKNDLGKPEVKSDTPLKADIAVSLKVVQDPGKQFVKDEGKPLTGGKED